MEDGTAADGQAWQKGPRMAGLPASTEPVIGAPALVLGINYWPGEFGPTALPGILATGAPDGAPTPAPAARAAIEESQETPPPSELKIGTPSGFYDYWPSAPPAAPAAAAFAAAPPASPPAPAPPAAVKDSPPSSRGKVTSVMRFLLLASVTVCLVCMAEVVATIPLTDKSRVNCKVLVLVLFITVFAWGFAIRSIVELCVPENKKISPWIICILLFIAWAFTSAQATIESRFGQAFFVPVVVAACAFFVALVLSLFLATLSSPPPPQNEIL